MSVGSVVTVVAHRPPPLPSPRVPRAARSSHGRCGVAAHATAVRRHDAEVASARAQERLVQATALLQCQTDQTNELRAMLSAATLSPPLSTGYTASQGSASAQSLPPSAGLSPAHRPTVTTAAAAAAAGVQALDTLRIAPKLWVEFEEFLREAPVAKTAAAVLALPFLRRCWDDDVAPCLQSRCRRLPARRIADLMLENRCDVEVVHVDRTPSRGAEPRRVGRGASLESRPLTRVPSSPAPHPPAPRGAGRSGWPGGPRSVGERGGDVAGPGHVCGGPQLARVWTAAASVAALAHATGAAARLRLAPLESRCGPGAGAHGGVRGVRSRQVPPPLSVALRRPSSRHAHVRSLWPAAACDRRARRRRSLPRPLRRQRRVARRRPQLPRPAGRRRRVLRVCAPRSVRRSHRGAHGARRAGPDQGPATSRRSRLGSPRRRGPRRLAATA